MSFYLISRLNNYSSTTYYVKSLNVMNVCSDLTVRQVEKDLNHDRDWSSNILLKKKNVRACLHNYVLAQKKKDKKKMYVTYARLVFVLIHTDCSSYRCRWKVFQLSSLFCE